MPFCIRCGVELADSEAKCPLCGTEVYHPDIRRDEGKKLYPPSQHSQEETLNRSGVLLAMFVVTVVFCAALIIPLLCDASLSGKVTWSRFTVSSILFAYVVLILPAWFKRANPVIFSSADFAAAILFLLYLDLSLHGGWFLSFAFPVSACLALIVVTVITLSYYVRRGYLYIYGGAIIACGFFTVLLEFLLNVTFQIQERFIWSFYSFVSCFLLGMALIVIAISRPLRESLHKRFFL